MIYFAHRGASHYAPENTASAFELAVKMGAVAAELDVHLASDGVPVVHHDYDLSHTALAAVKIAGLSCPELKKYDLGAYFAGWKKPEPMLTLCEALNILGPKMLVNVELKNDGGVYPALENSVLQSCSGRLVETLFSSFDLPSLARLRGLEARARIGVLVKGVDFEASFAAAEKLGAESLHLSMRKLDRALADRAHSRGLKVFVYTIDDVKDALRAQAMGADGIFTNRPDLRREVDAAGPGGA